MAIVNFPPIQLADENGLLAIGGDLQIDSLLLAYSRGIFPWPISDDYPLAWFTPDPRGIIKFSDLHIPKSLAKTIKKNKFIIKFNTNFEAVINACADCGIRKDKNGTWINKDIISSYIDLFNAGFAYSVEAYISKDDQELLVGGVYGVSINNFYSGESMFFKETDASKVCLIALIEKLKGLGVQWLDTQMVTSVVGKLGGNEVSRQEFMKLLSISYPKDQLAPRPF